MSSKKSKGKQKINIEKIKKYEDRMVALSKRRSGIYTKLSELSINCGADVGFLVYSDTGKPYTFGSPSFDAVADRFLNGNSSSTMVHAHENVKIQELCKEYNRVREELEAEEKKLAAAKASSLPVDKYAWWRAEPENEEEVKRLIRTWEEFRQKLSDESARRGGGDASSSLPHNN